jgi:ATP-dependent Zn protease
LPEPGVLSRVRDADRTTRKPLAFWDRSKFLLLLVVLFWVFVWADMADNPILPFQDALNRTFESKWWVIALIGLEAIRQAHFLLAETWPGYHRLWSDSIFGRFERRMARFNDWNRFRIARIVKLIAVLALLSVVLGAIFDVAPATALFELPARVISALPMFAQFLIYPLVFISQFALLFWFLSRGGVDVYYPDDIETRLDDVWGQDPVVERVRESMLFLEDPEKIEEKGGYVPGGILLWGPPGTGKTLMAEAVAGETGKPFVFVDPGAFINMFMGVGIIKVKALFRKLRKLALRYGGVIVFFDEADSLGSRSLSTQGGLGEPMAGRGWDDHTRWLSPASQELLVSSPVPDGPEAKKGVMMMGGAGGGGMGTLQALLTELSGLKKPRGLLNRYGRRLLGLRPKAPPKYRILVMMATNMPQALDEALLRPGRLDRIYKVGYPSKEGRKRTYQGYLDKVEHELTDEQLEKLATITPYATGATIKDLVNEALIVAIRDQRQAITWRDVLEAKKLKDLGPPEDVEYIERERHAIAVHEACHAIAFHRETRDLSIDLATIEKGGTYLGFVRGIRVEDQFTRWRSHFEADIKVSLASLAGEREFFGGDSSSGVSGDLDSATTVATYMEGFWGMGSTISSFGAINRIGLRPGGQRPGNDEDQEKELLRNVMLSQRIEANLARLLTETETLIRENRHEILAVAHALEQHKTIPGEDVVAIIEGTEGTIVDGRLYHDESARRLLEEYHEHAMRAHRDNAPVEARLPVLTNGHRPVVAASNPTSPPPA